MQQTFESGEIVRCPGTVANGAPCQKPFAKAHGRVVVAVTAGPDGAGAPLTYFCRRCKAVLAVQLAEAA